MNFLIGLMGALQLFSWLRVAHEARATEAMTREFPPPSPDPKSLPKLSVIVPARDEGAGIRACLNSLAAQEYPGLEVILVNDRSADSTGAVMQEFVAAHPHWKYVEVKELPPQWLGKNHALHQGSRLAGGDWLLFTDGDVVFEKSALTLSVSHAIRRGLGHFVLGCRFVADGIVLGALQTFFAVILLAQVRPSQFGKSKKAFIGSGAFNLVRRDLYLQAGGHERLRLEVIDDVMLGKVMMEAGAKLEIVDSKGLVSVRWYDSVWGMIQGCEKNAFAWARYSVWRVALLLFSTIWFHLLPYVAIWFASGPAFWILATDLAFVHLMFAIAGVKVGQTVLVSPLVPVSAWILCYMNLRSAWKTLRRGAVVWRGTAYDLETIRRHMA